MTDAIWGKEDFLNDIVLEYISFQSMIINKVSLAGCLSVLLCQSNCSGPIPTPNPTPRKPRGQRENVCDKKGGALQKRVKFVII